ETEMVQAIELFEQEMSSRCEIEDIKKEENT
ncbi:MAG: hypothetical protein QG639_319, partial [Patescibacteria group bacterium]|nr:hypothetical protein [Patescibacteria group bacterium]